MNKTQLLLARAGMLPVVAVAAWTSYWHMVEVATTAGEHIFTAHILPFSVDGLMLTASVVLKSAKTRRAKAVSAVALLFGFLASGAANWIASEPAIVSRVVGLWPALALLVAVELLLHTNRATVRTAPARRPAAKKVTKPAQKPEAETAAPKAPRTRKAAPVPATAGSAA